MNQENIILRPICRKDNQAIENIIRRTWKYDSICADPKDARHMARLYLRACLRRASFSCVAEEKGQVLGVILADCKTAAHPGKLYRALAQAWAVGLLFTSKSGRRLGRFFQGFDRTDEELLRETYCSFDGEICLFAMEESARGKGVGKRLFSEAMKYLKEQKAKKIYLFTDSSCTWQFYEKRGMVRLGEKVVEISPRVGYNLHMYIYGCEM